MDTHTIEARGLGRSFGDQVVIEKTSFTAQSGMAVALTSPSGSGKSTLLSMLGLLLTPTSGEVLVDGVSTKGMGDAQLAAMRSRTFGFIFQHTQLIGSLRAWENVAVPARFVKHPAFDPKERSQELLERFGLGERLYHYPHQLSVGQKRRIAAARALLLDPPILIADEPTNDLDAESAGSVTEMLFQHARQGGILLYASHDQALVGRADLVLRLTGRTFTA